MGDNRGKEGLGRELGEHAVAEGAHDEGDGEEAERQSEERGEKILLEGNVQRKTELAGKCHKVFFEAAPGGEEVDSEEAVADAQQAEAEDDREDVIEEKLGEARLSLLSVLNQCVEAEKTEDKREKEKVEENVGGRISQHKAAEQHHSHRYNTDSEQKQQTPKVITIGQSILKIARDPHLSI